MFQHAGMTATAALESFVPDAGARCLLLGCAGVVPCDRVLLAGETGTGPFFDSQFCPYVAATAERLGANVRILISADPGRSGPFLDAILEAMKDADHAIFFSRWRTHPLQGAGRGCRHHRVLGRRPRAALRSCDNRHRWRSLCAQLLVYRHLPADYYSGRAEDDPEHWGDFAFGSPGYTHLRACGRDPGDVSVLLFETLVRTQWP